MTNLKPEDRDRDCIQVDLLQLANGKFSGSGTQKPLNLKKRADSEFLHTGSKEIRDDQGLLVGLELAEQCALFLLIRFNVVCR